MKWSLEKTEESQAAGRDVLNPATIERQSVASGQYPDDALRAIKDSAAALFGEFGFEGVSTRDIASRAKVKQPTIYHYFESKGVLYETVVAEAGDRVSNRMISLLRDDKSTPEAKILAFYRAEILNLHKDTTAARLIDRELLEQEHGKTSFHSDVMRAVYGALTDVLLELAPGSPAAQLAFVMFCTSFGVRKMKPLLLQFGDVEDFRNDELLCEWLAELSVQTSHDSTALKTREASGDQRDGVTHRLAALEKENADLRSLVVNLSLENAAIKKAR